MMPKAKMEARVNAPPVKRDKMSPKPPEPSWLICSAKTSLFTPGSTMNEPKRYTKIKPSVTPNFWRNSSWRQMSPSFWKNLILRGGQSSSTFRPRLQWRQRQSC